MAKSSANNDWSDALKAQTRKLIDSRGPIGTSDCSLSLKNTTNSFGIITESDLVNGVLRVVDRKTKAETTFATADDLIAAGWVLD